MKKLVFLIIVILAAGSISLTSAENNKFEKPILISSAGQSADVTLAGMLLKKIKVEHTAKPLAVTSDLEGIHTLILVPGFSSKGLGAAGISRDDELARVRELIAAAKEKDIRILMLHLGGTSRRGQQSDDFNQMAAEASSEMVVVEQGNEDGFFTDIAEKNNIEISQVEKITGAAAVLKDKF